MRISPAEVNDGCTALFTRVSAGVPYVAVDESLTVDPLVPEAVAVLGCEPDTAAIGPNTQTAI